MLFGKEKIKAKVVIDLWVSWSWIDYKYCKLKGKKIAGFCKGERGEEVSISNGLILADIIKGEISIDENTTLTNMNFLVTKHQEN